MLTRSLQDLEEYGLVIRIQHSVIPPHVEYFLTEHSKNLIPIMTLISEWGKDQMSREKNELFHYKDKKE